MVTCRCGALFDVDELKKQLKIENEFYDRAEERFVNRLLDKCCVCAETHDETGYKETVFEKYIHRFCKVCFEDVKRNIKERKKTGENANVIRCKTCMKEHLLDDKLFEGKKKCNIF